jgi:hypothetical protein
MTDRCSGSRLRAELDRRGMGLSHDQLRRFLEVGLLPRPGEDGRWPPRTLVSLIRIVRLGREVTSLDRRLLRLRRNYHYFPVEPDKLREAMVRILPSMEAPVRKMRLVADYARSPMPADRRLPVVTAPSRRQDPNLKRRRPLREQQIPHPDEWAEILERVDVGRIGLWAVGWYAWLGDVIPAHYAPDSDPLGWIPFEERVTLYAILDIAAHAPTALDHSYPSLA